MPAPGDEAPDGVDVQVCDVEVGEAEAEAHVDVVDPNVHVGCDLPMSIYLQAIIVITFVSKLLRSNSGQFSN